MSTKIYNGYKLKASSLEEAVNILYQLKPEAHEKIEYYLTEKEILKAVELLEEDYILKAITKDISDEQIKESKSIMELVNKQKWHDFVNKNTEEKSEEVEIILYPQKFTENNENYYLLNCYGNDNLTKWLNENFSEYMYFNNTDKPENLSDEQWSRRYEDWSYVLIGETLSGVPKKEGISIMLAQCMLPYMNINDSKNAARVNKILNSINEKFTKNKRIEIYIENYFVNKAINEEVNARGIKDDKERLINEMMGIYLDTKRAYQKQVDNPERDALKNILNIKLKDELTWEDINTPLNELLEKIVN